MRISDWSSDVCSSDLYYLHLLRRCGDGLVRPASLVAEASRQCVVRHDPEADLVGDEDELTLEPLNRLTKIARRGVDNGLRQHEVGHPARQAIDQNDGVRPVGGVDCVGNIERCPALPPSTAPCCPAACVGTGISAAGEAGV